VTIKFWKHKSKLLIIDGRNLLWRTTDAFSDLHVKKKAGHIATGGVYGFLSTMIRIWDRYGGKTVVAWEGKGNFRFELFPGYKDRGEPTEEMIDLIDEVNDQQKRVQAILRRAGIEQYKGVDCEADDVMGRLAYLWTRRGEDQAVIYTGDSDLRQCVTAYTWVVSPQRKAKEVVYDVNGVKEKDGVYPHYIPDLKALAGDTSDKIPGLPGVGQVTAAKLVNAFGDVEEIITAAKKKATWKDQNERFRLLVKGNKNELRLYKKLTKIKIKAKYHEIETKKSRTETRKHLMFYRFHSLIIPSELQKLMTMGNNDQ